MKYECKRRIKVTLRSVRNVIPEPKAKTLFFNNSPEKADASLRSA